MNRSAQQATAVPPPRETTTASQPQLIGQRYQVLNRLGAGASGDVYRVFDRLFGRVATLKRLKAPLQTSGSESSDRMALAQEFQLLASLHHPNIISVSDFGFDGGGEPFLTMDLEENARTIVDAGRGRPLAVQVDLLVQALRALVYLHRHGIIHRDIKPENVLVVGDQAKLLDFGLSVRRRDLDAESPEYAGTPAYMAPEVWLGAPPSERSDLFALGLVAYEMFVPGASAHASHRRADFSGAGPRLPRPGDDLDGRLRPVLERLLARHPGDRYGSATEVVGDLGRVLGQSLAVETVSTRESFLQAAPFVGRTAELKILDEAFEDARAGRGATWLVGGSSGVGKSRLLEEVRIRALVKGAIVLRGQAVSQGRRPYQVWRDVAAEMVLHAPPERVDAPILRTLVPNIATLLGCHVEDPGALEPDAAQSRLQRAVEKLLLAAAAPVVVILEDLQWAGSESLQLLRWLSTGAGERTLLFLATFRNDEGVDVAAAVEGTRQMVLGPLDPADVTRLCESAIGAEHARPEVVALVQRESEGLPLFVVEVLRSLAESSGVLERIGTAPLPERVSGDAMQRVLRARLSHFTGASFAALRSAAVVGRAVDTAMLRRLHPEVDGRAWTEECAAGHVLENRDGAWRFVHDKLREQLLADLPVPERRSMHREVAAAIEAEYAGRPEYFAALAHHWHQAGVDDKEAVYAERAGLQALENSACQEAVGYLTRAAELLSSPGAPTAPASPRRFRPAALLDLNAGIDTAGPAYRLARVEAALADAHFRLGEMGAARAHGRLALDAIGQSIPGGNLSWALACARELARLGCLQVWKARPGDPRAARDVASTLGMVETRFIECFLYAFEPAGVLWSILRVINRCSVAGVSTWLAHGYLHLSWVAEILHLERLAARLRTHAARVAGEAGNPSGEGFVCSRTASIASGLGNWPVAAANLDRALAVATDVGDTRLIEEVNAQRAGYFFWTSSFPQAIEIGRDTAVLCRRSGNRQVLGWTLLACADSLLRLGRPAEALPLYGEVLGAVDRRATLADTIWCLGGYSLARLRCGDPAGAYEAACEAVTRMRGLRPVAYWMQQGSAAVCEVFLSLLEQRWIPPAGGLADLQIKARASLAFLRSYARSFPLGRTLAALWAANEAWLSGRHRRAVRLWQRAAAMAGRYHQPYEAARAELEWGRHLEPGDPERRRHLDAARAMFAELGCRAEIPSAADARNDRR